MADAFSPEAMFAADMVQHCFERACAAFDKGDTKAHTAAADSHKGWAYVYLRHAHGLTLH